MYARTIKITFKDKMSKDMFVNILILKQMLKALEMEL